MRFCCLIRCHYQDESAANKAGRKSRKSGGKPGQSAAQHLGQLAAFPISGRPLQIPHKKLFSSYLSFSAALAQFSFIVSLPPEE